MSDSEHRSILWIHPATQAGIAGVFVVVCIGMVFYWDPAGWGVFRKVLGGLLAGLAAYYSIFNNRIIVTYFGDLPDGGGAEEPPTNPR